MGALIVSKCVQFFSGSLYSAPLFAFAFCRLVVQSWVNITSDFFFMQLVQDWQRKGAPVGNPSGHILIYFDSLWIASTGLDKPWVANPHR